MIVETKSTQNNKGTKMKQIRTLFSMVGVIALLALMAGCATTASFPQDKANMLVAAGFKTVTPKTAAQQQKLQQMQTGQVARSKKTEEPTTLSRIRLRTWSMWVDRTSIRLINKCALNTSLHKRTSKLLRCIRTQQCSGMHGVAGELAGDEWAME